MPSRTFVRQVPSASYVAYDLRHKLSVELPAEYFLTHGPQTPANRIRLLLKDSRVIEKGIVLGEIRVSPRLDLLFQRVFIVWKFST